MSYSHCWEWEIPIIDSMRFAQWSNDISILLQQYSSYAHWYGEYTVPYPPISDNRAMYKICGPLGSGEPIITENQVAFNGNEDTQSDNETFCIALEDLHRPYIGCSCTASKPYNLLVTAALVRLAFYFPEIEVSSDLGFGAFQQGTLFCRDIFSKGDNPVLEWKLRVHGQNSPQPLLNNVCYYPNLFYLMYIIAWYSHLHPQETIRYATFEGRVCIETNASHDLHYPLYFDIINDSKQCVWNVRTGIVPEVFVPNIGQVGFGTMWPDPDYLIDEGGRLAKQFRVTHYQLGTLEGDIALKQNGLSQSHTVYFRDGTIMLVRIPSHITRKNGIPALIKGILEYRIIQTPMASSDIIVVVDKEDYRTLYKTTDPRFD